VHRPSMLVALLLTSSLLRPVPRSGPVSCSLRTVDDNVSLEALIRQTANSNAIVVIHFEDPVDPSGASSSWDTPSREWPRTSFQDSFASGLVKRVAETYSTSTLYGGSPLIVLQIDRDVAPTICSARGIVSFPTTQIWARNTCTEVSSVELEKKLLSLGVASASKAMKGGVRDGTNNRVGRNVDDIDFTGGAGGRALFEKGDRGTTGRFQNFGDGSRNSKDAKKPGDFGYVCHSQRESNALPNSQSDSHPAPHYKRFD